MLPHFTRTSYSFKAAPGKHTAKAGFGEQHRGIMSTAPLSSSSSNYRSQLARQERELFNRELQLKELEQKKQLVKPDLSSGTVLDRRTSGRQDAEQRQIQNNIRRMAEDAASEVTVYAKSSSSTGGVSSVSSNVLGQPRLGVQNLKPEVQPTPVEASGPLTKRELCQKNCGCHLIVCRKYGNIWH
jgi:hypothetical protein